MLSASYKIRQRPPFISELTQQDGRKKKTAERLCVTNVTRLFPTCFVVIFTCFLVFYKKIYLKESEVWRKVISNKIMVTLVTHGLLIGGGGEGRGGGEKNWNIQFYFQLPPTPTFYFAPPLQNMKFL